MEAKDLNEDLINAIFTPDPEFEDDIGRVMFTTKHFFQYFLDQGMDLRDVYVPIMYMAMGRFFYESKDLEHAKQEVQGFLLEALSSEFDKRLENKEDNSFQADFFSLYISEGNKTFQ